MLKYPVLRRVLGLTKAQSAALLDAVATGEEVVISRRGQTKLAVILGRPHTSGTVDWLTRLQAPHRQLAGTRSWAVELLRELWDQGLRAQGCQMATWTAAGEVALFHGDRGDSGAAFMLNAVWGPSGCGSSANSALQQWWLAPLEPRAQHVRVPSHKRQSDGKVAQRDANAVPLA